jgi:hypothetical protein
MGRAVDERGGREDVAFHVAVVGEDAAAGAEGRVEHDGAAQRRAEGVVEMVVLLNKSGGKARDHTAAAIGDIVDRERAAQPIEPAAIA